MDCRARDVHVEMIVSGWIRICAFGFSFSPGRHSLSKAMIDFHDRICVLEPKAKLFLWFGRLLPSPWWTSWTINTVSTEKHPPLHDVYGLVVQCKTGTGTHFHSNSFMWSFHKKANTVAEDGTGLTAPRTGINRVQKQEITKWCSYRLQPWFVDQQHHCRHQERANSWSPGIQSLWQCPRAVGKGRAIRLELI